MENKKYHTVGRVSKSNSKISERGKLHISFSTCYINVPGCMFKPIAVLFHHLLVLSTRFHCNMREATCLKDEILKFQ